jgi:hypothetical protein
VYSGVGVAVVGRFEPEWWMDRRFGTVGGWWCRRALSHTGWVDLWHSSEVERLGALLWLWMGASKKKMKK